MSNDSKASLLDLPAELFDNILGRLDRTSLVRFCGTRSDMAEAISSCLCLTQKSFAFFSDSTFEKDFDRWHDSRAREAVESIWLFSLPGKNTTQKLNELYDKVNISEKHATEAEEHVFKSRQQEASYSIPVFPNASKLFINLDTLEQLGDRIQSLEEGQTVCPSLDLSKWQNATRICISVQDLPVTEGHNERVMMTTHAAERLLETTFQCRVPKSSRTEPPTSEPVNNSTNAHTELTMVLHLHGLLCAMEVPTHVDYKVHVDYMKLLGPSANTLKHRSRCQLVAGIINRQTRTNGSFSSKEKGPLTVSLTGASSTVIDRIINEVESQAEWRSTTSRIVTAKEMIDCAICHMKTNP